MYDSVKTAQKISDILIKKGMTVKKLGEMCEQGSRADSIISDIRRKRCISIELFCRISTILDVPLSDLVDNSGVYKL